MHIEANGEAVAFWIYFKLWRLISSEEKESSECDININDRDIYSLSLEMYLRI